MRVLVVGDERLVGRAEVVEAAEGWELRVETVAGAAAQLTSGTLMGLSPATVVFDFIPHEWGGRKSRSEADGAAVQFIADSAEEDGALRRLEKARWLEFGMSLTQLARSAATSVD